MPATLFLSSKNMFFIFEPHFGAENGPQRAWEVFNKLPGSHSFVLTEYEPVMSHGNPVQDNFINFGHIFASQMCDFEPNEPKDSKVVLEARSPLSGLGRPQTPERISV